MSENLERRVQNLEVEVNKLWAKLNQQQLPSKVDGRDVLVGLDSAVSVKLEVYDANGETRVRPREWLGRNTWADVNSVLKQQGFMWESKGKDSYWHRRT